MNGGELMVPVVVLTFQDPEAASSDPASPEERKSPGKETQQFWGQACPAPAKVQQLQEGEERGGSVKR